MSRPEAGAGGAERVVVFRVAGRRFALPLAPVLEIIRHRPPTPVPGAAAPVIGILPVRGRMVTLVDARLTLGIGGGVPGNGAQVIVLDGDRDGLLGLVVDEVQGVAAAEAGLRLVEPGSLLAADAPPGGGS